MQIQRLKSKIQSLETDLHSIKEGNTSGKGNHPKEQIVIQQVPNVQISAEISAGNADSITKLSNQLIMTLDELDSKNKILTDLKVKMEEVHQDSEICKHQLGVVYEEYLIS